jgi:hypothetical protein
MNANCFAMTPQFNLQSLVQLKLVIAASKPDHFRRAYEPCLICNKPLFVAIGSLQTCNRSLQNEICLLQAEYMAMQSCNRVISSCNDYSATEFILLQAAIGSLQSCNGHCKPGNGHCKPGSGHCRLYSHHCRLLLSVEPLATTGI